MNILKKLIYFVFFIVLLPHFSYAVDDTAYAPWPIFGHDSQHTNVSPYEIGKDKKEVLWSYKAEGGIESSPAISTDDTIYVGSHDGFFYAFNKDGSLKWKTKLTEPIYDPRWNISKAMMASPAIAKDGTIYINTASGYLHALNPDSTEKWRFAINWASDFWNSPNIESDGTIYIGTARSEEKNEESGLYAINPDGSKKWFSPEPSGITIVPTMVNDKMIVSGAANTNDNKGKIIMLDSASGEKKWEFWLEEWLEGSAAVTPDGTIYSGSKEGIVYAVNSDGTEKWRFETKGGISATPTIGNDGNVYIGSWDGIFYALDQKTGENKWQFDAKSDRDPKLFEGYPGKETIITNAALSKDGILVFADVFDTVYALDLTGKELWRWKNEKGNGFASSPAIAKDGTIYIGDEGGNFFALGKNQNLQLLDTKDINNSSLKKYLLFAAIFILIITVIIFALYWRKKHEGNNRALKILLMVFVVLSLAVISASLYYTFYPTKQDSQSKNSQEESQEQTKTTQTQPKDEFIKNALRVSDSIDLYIREFGETGRSCAGKDCAALKDTCVRWNKTKDECYEMVKTSPATSDKYKIYCNMVVVNQDKNKTADVSLDLVYTTTDSQKHLVQKESYKIEPQKGQSLLWAYEVDANNIGKCGYDNIIVEEK